MRGGLQSSSFYRAPISDERRRQVLDRRAAKPAAGSSLLRAGKELLLGGRNLQRVNLARL